MVDKRRFCPDHNHAQPEGAGILCDYLLGDRICGKPLLPITHPEAKKNIRRYVRLPEGETYEAFLAWKAIQSGPTKRQVKPTVHPRVRFWKVSGGLPSLGKHQ
jgi:hypothetical protein